MLGSDGRMNPSEEKRAEIDAILVEHGDLYSFEDIIPHISDGRMQSFAFGDSWIVTQVGECPRRRTLDMVFAYGDADELESALGDAENFAKGIGASLMTTTGRFGWRVRAEKHGFKRYAASYMKEL